MAGSSSSTKKEWLLKREAEIRCEVQENELLTLRLVAGSAEIFGVEMAPNKDYMFKDQNIAVFTWYGCTIESSGADNAIYLADSTPMISYVNTHVQLQAKRDVALNNSDYGPRVMIVGPTDHGKSTLAQLLSVYAVRMDRSPIYVDLDVGQSALSIPGCISAAQLGKANISVEVSEFLDVELSDSCFSKLRFHTTLGRINELHTSGVLLRPQHTQR